MKQIKKAYQSIKHLGKWSIPVLLAIPLADFSISYLEGWDLNAPVTILDIYQILFFSNHYMNYEYINPENIYCYLPVFLYYFSGAMFTILSFVQKTKKVLPFLFTRYGTSKSAFCHVKGNTFFPHLLYTVLFLSCVHIICYLKLPLLYKMIEPCTLFIISMLSCIHNALILSMLHCFAFLVFRRKDEGYAVCYTIFFLLFLFIIDIPLPGFCIITLDYGFTQVASTTLALICFCVLHHKAVNGITTQEIF